MELLKTPLLPSSLRLHKMKKRQVLLPLTPDKKQNHLSPSCHQQKHQTNSLLVIDGVCCHQLQSDGVEGSNCLPHQKYQLYFYLAPRPWLPCASEYIVLFQTNMQSRILKVRIWVIVTTSKGSGAMNKHTNAEVRLVTKGH